MVSKRQRRGGSAGSQPASQEERVNKRARARNAPPFVLILKP